ncbi:MAG: cupin domain-containing protein [Thiotrichales bacterium]|nr:cupin domain-containing protein [Thiotrichales bacterium]MCY4284531.1 cupin domain-containing protein [Thiotrichales bacterium]MCY4351236.1 cupin domain-containing protein [Thiotrichales bacterium]
MRRERNTFHDEATGAYFGESMPITRAEMDARVWRFRSLVPSPRAFLDCTLPGHVRTLYSALGAGADDEQLEGTAVEDAENYFIDFVKAGPGNGAALHSHGSEETFIALTGRWEIYWGDNGGESVVLDPFDGIVVPGGVLRGFRNAGAEESVLLTVLGAHGTGACVWSRDLRDRFAEVAGGAPKGAG